MTENVLSPLTQPTMYFIGVTTGQSSSKRLFPRWAAILGIDAQLVGYDIALNAPPGDYRRIVEHIKREPLAQGALVTTHKIDLLEATSDLFDELDVYADLCCEVSCISKHEGRLHGTATDPIAAGLTWEAFIEFDHWQRTGGHVLCLGAGGSGVASSVYAAGLEHPPERYILVDMVEARLAKAQVIHQQLDTAMQFEYVLSNSAEQNDRLLAQLPDSSLVINATGMGKDRAGSPLTDGAQFPKKGIVWEFNYRGERQFLQQAKRQENTQHLHIEDGWTFFLHGWSMVVAKIFHLDLTSEIFRQFATAAEMLRS